MLPALPDDAEPKIIWVEEATSKPDGLETLWACEDSDTRINRQDNSPHDDLLSSGARSDVGGARVVKRQKQGLCQPLGLTGVQAPRALRIRPRSPGLTLTTFGLSCDTKTASPYLWVSTWQKILFSIAPPPEKNQLGKAASNTLTTVAERLLGDEIGFVLLPSKSDCGGNAS